MTEQDFLQSIYHDADDDVPRLIFSDWLEEHGNPDRAQFIRLQLARANDETGDASRPELMEQERELFERHKEEWLRELPELPGVEWGASFDQSHVDLHDFERGFPFRARISDFASFPGQASRIRTNTTARSLCFLLPDWGWQSHLLKLLQCPMIAAFPHLEILPAADWNFATADIHLGKEGLRMLAACRYLDGVRTLRVNGHAIGDDGADILAKSPRFSALTELGLGENELTSQGLRFLAQSAGMTQLRHLNLSSASSLNPFDAVGLTALSASNSFRRLQSLRLGSTKLDDAAVTALSQGSLPGLRFLDLSLNRISAVGLRSLATSEISSSLRELRISDNPLGTAGAIALIKGMPSSHLHTLDLSETRLGTEAVYVLGGSALGQGLGQLNFHSNPIGIEGMRFFLERRYWPNLRKLGLSYMPHERDVAESLKEVWGERIELTFQAQVYSV